MESNFNLSQVFIRKSKKKKKWFNFV